MLHLQSPGAEGPDLLTALLAAAAEASSGGAMFAFASAAGIDLFLGDDVLWELASTTRFDLIIGFDAITDSAALAKLVSYEDELEHLEVQAFVHDRSSLFHPKIAWFRVGRRLQVVAGSGNLTLGGLRGNWEAFTDELLDEAAARAARENIENWLNSHAAFLLPLSDARVIEAAQRNTRERSVLPRRGRRVIEALGETLAEPEDVVGLRAEEVLVAEIPRASTRWNQANFDKKNYEDFFGVPVGSHGRIVLREVGPAATLGPFESRPGVAVRSRNYRFELAAAAGLAYPTIGRPIGVFAKMESGVFLYRLLMPSDAGYAETTGLLATLWHGSPRNVRRVRTDIATLRDHWPDSPLLLVKADDIAAAT